MHHYPMASRRNGARREQWTAQAEQLLDLLSTLGNTIFRQFLWQRAAELDLTYAQGQVLFHVAAHPGCRMGDVGKDRKSTRLNSSHSQISYAVFCLKKKKKTHNNRTASDNI